MNQLSNLAIILAADLPAGKPITFNEVHSLIQYIAQFIVIISIIIAIITFTISGITYMTAAGSNDRVKKAQTMFMNGIWGTLIVLSVGVIINTLAGVVTRDFFCQVSWGGVCFF